VTPETIRERQERPKRKAATPVAEPVGNADLLADLKALRRRIAQEIAKPAYVVFSDASLIDMAARKPSDIYAFRLVHGVGDHKATAYGDRFMRAIAEFGAGGGGAAS